MVSAVRKSFCAWRSLPNLFGRHFAILFAQTDPMQIVEADVDRRPTSCSPSSDDIHRHFLFGFLNCLICFLFGTLGLQLLDGGQIDWAGIQAGTTPHLFSHQCAPDSLWPQVDIGLIVIDCSFTAVMLAVDALLPALPSRFNILYYPDSNTVCIGERTLSQAETVVMYRLHSRADRLIRYLWPAFYLFAVGTYELLFVSMVDYYTPARLIFWCLGFPVLFFYIIYCLFARVIYIILVSFYLRTQQKALQQKLSVIIREVEQPKQNQRAHLLMCYQYFRTLNGRLMGVLGQIHAYAGYCGYILSLLLPFYITIQGYMVILAFFMPDTSALFRYPLMLYILAVNGLLFFIIRQCAGVVTNNDAFRRGCLRFTLAHKRAGGFRLLTARELIKTELFVDSRRFKTYSFWLAGDYRITSQTYSLIISYISIVLMYLYKQDVKHLTSASV